MLKLLQVFALVVLAFLVLAIFAVKQFGLLGFLFVVVFFAFCLSLLQRLIGKWLKKLFLSPFLAKGAVLRDAEVRVRSITPATAPTNESYGDEDYSNEATKELSANAPPDWYALDVTITPQEFSDGTSLSGVAGGGFTSWEPSELVLIAPDGRPGDINNEAEELGRVHAVEVWREGRWQPDEIGKYEGPQRLKLLVGIRPGAHRLRFRYYFEVFGELEIPVEMRGV